MAFQDPFASSLGQSQIYQPTNTLDAYSSPLTRDADSLVAPEPYGSPFTRGIVNYFDDPFRTSTPVPGFIRSADLLTLDSDPFGTMTSQWSKTAGTEHGTDYVAGLSVFGRAMSREQLEQSDAGRRLLEISEKNREGRKRGFWDAVTDFQWSDLPFLSLFASVGKSIMDAKTVSDAMKKLQNGEPVTDDELIKTRLYMAEQEYSQNGSWGATVGDIVRAAPGFMVEFLVSGGIFSGVRTLASKALGTAGKAAVHTALTRAEKKAAMEATELAAKSWIKKSGKELAGASYSALAEEKTRDSIIKEVSDRLYKFMTDADSAVNPLFVAKNGVLKESDKAVMRELANKRAEYEFGKMLARNSSDHAIVNGMHKFAQWAGRHASSGLLDFGSWGTEEATVLTSGFTSAKAALGDAVGAMFVEAPLRGSLLMVPNQFMVKPLLEKVTGIEAVSAAQLGLQQSALLKGDKRLMEDADSIASGMNWLEYVSENAGRGFGSLAKGVGLWFDKLGVASGVKGIVRPAATSMAGAGMASHEGFRIGSMLREWWSKAIGSRKDFLTKSLDDKVNVVGEAIRAAGKTVDDRAIRQALQTNSVNGILPREVIDVVGNDIGKYADDALAAAYKDHGEKLAYKTYARFWVADFMTRHGIGPESMINLYDRMGYDGVLGEMLEERYSDVAKGLFGWNDKDDHSFKARLTEAIKGLYPGFDQLTAEAVGFAFPMVTRMASARAMASIGGEGKFAKLRSKLEPFGDLTARTMWKGRLMEYFDVHDETMREQQDRVDRMTRDLTAAENTGDSSEITRAKDALDFAVRTRDRYKETHEKWITGYSGKISGRLEERVTQATKAVEAARASGNEEAVAAADAELTSAVKARDAYAESVKTNTAGEGKTLDQAVREWAAQNVDELVAVEPLSASLSETEGIEYTMRPVNDDDKSDKAMQSVDNLVDFTPELMRTLYELDAPMEGESPSWYRTIAAKAVGIAGAIVSGDISLAMRDPGSWISRDMGLGRDFVKSLKDTYLAKRKEVAEKLRNEFVDASIEERQRLMAMYGVRLEDLGDMTGDTFAVPEKTIDDATQNAIAPVARRMMQSYLASRMVRSFSQGQMRDQALILHARKMGYDVLDMENRTFAKSKQVEVTPGGVNETREETTVDKYWRDHLDVADYAAREFLVLNGYKTAPSATLKRTRKEVVRPAKTTRRKAAEFDRSRFTTKDSVLAEYDRVIGELEAQGASRDVIDDLRKERSAVAAARDLSDYTPPVGADLGVYVDDVIEPEETRDVEESYELSGRQGVYTNGEKAFSNESAISSGILNDPDLGGEFLDFLDKRAKDRGLEVEARDPAMSVDEAFRTRKITKVTRTNAPKQSTSGIDEDTRVSFDRFLEDNKDEVSRLTNRISRATLDILCNREKLSVDDRVSVMDIVNLPENADMETTAVYDAAMRLAGFSRAISTMQLRADRSVEQTLKDSACSLVSAPVAEAVARQAMKPDGTVDFRAVQRELLESIAYSLGLSFDGTREGLEKRDRKIAELCVLASQVSKGKGDRAYFRMYYDPRKVDTRMTDGGSVIVEARLNKDGKWEVKDRFVQEGGEKEFSVTGNSLDELLVNLKGCERFNDRDIINVEKAEAKIVWTQARVLATDDMATMLRAVGMTTEYVNRCRRAAGDTENREAYVHPLYRKTEDGNWAYDEKRAMEVYQEEAALAGNYDGKTKTLIRMPRDGATPEEIRAAAEKASAAWEHLYGDHGYVTVGNAMLRAANVHVGGILGAGVAKGTGYSISMNAFAGRDGNVYVPVDFRHSTDLKDSLLNARLLQAYALHPRELGNVFRSGITGFLDELDALALRKIRDARKAGDPGLADALVEFRNGCTRKVMRYSEDGKGRRVVPLTPQSFATLASICLYRDKRNQAEGYGGVSWVKALAEISDDARMLCSFRQFEVAVDVVLGGSGFLTDSVRDDKVEDVSGLTGLMRMYHNDPKALTTFMGDGQFLLPGVEASIGYQKFFEACDQLRTTFNIKPVISEDTKAVVKNGKTPRDRSRMFRKLGQDLNMTGDQVNRFVKAAVELARSMYAGEIAGTDAEAAFRERMSAVTEATTLARELAKNGKKLTEASGRLTEERRKREAAEADRNSSIREQKRLEGEIARLKRELDSKKKDPSATDAEIAELEAAIVRATAKAGEAKVLVGNALEILAKASKSTREFSGVVERLRAAKMRLEEVGIALEGEKETSDNGDDNTGADFGMPDDRFFMVGDMSGEGEGDVFLDLDGAFAGAELPGTRLVEFEDADMLAGSVFNEADARRAFVVVAKMLVGTGKSVDYSNMHDAVNRLFPTLPDEDKQMILNVLAELNSVSADTLGSTFERRLDRLLKDGLRWDGIENDGREESEGVETSSGNGDNEREAVKELDGEAMRTFMKLARYASPATGTNLQAFLTVIRESVGRRISSGSSSRADRFMYDLLNPRAITEYKGVAITNAADRDAVHHKLVTDVLTDSAKLESYISELLTTGTIAPFLLSYVSAMAPGDRERFIGLVSTAASAEAYKHNHGKGQEYDGSDASMEHADPESKRVSQAAVAATFSNLVGQDSSVALELKAGLEDTFSESNDFAGLKKLDKNFDQNDLMEVFEYNGEIIASTLASVFGEENPLTMALRSPTLIRFIRRSLTVDDETTSGKNVKRQFAERVENIVKNMCPSNVYSAAEDGNVTVVPFISDLTSALGALSSLEGTILTADHVESAATVAFVNGSVEQDSMTAAPRSSRVTNALSTFMATFASCQPQTILRADRDPGRSQKDSSVAITSRGVIPMIMRWLDDPAGFRKYVDTYFKGEVAAWMAGVEGKRILAEESVRTDAEGTAEDRAKERFLGICKQEMIWPDGTRMIAKCITTTSYMNEVYDGCLNDFTYHRLKGLSDVYLVPLYSGDHNSSVLLQVPWRVQGDMKNRSDITTDSDEVNRRLRGEDTAAPRGKDSYIAERWRLADIWDTLPSDAGTNDKSPVKVTVTDADGTTRELTTVGEIRRWLIGSFADMYRNVATDICNSVGLDLLGNDTKRSAVSSLEQRAMSLRGVKTETTDGKETVRFGRVRMHIMFNYLSRDSARLGKDGALGNEDFKGGTLMVGYGAERQRAAAKLQDTDTLKCHLISVSGRDLSFLKSLISSPRKNTGDYYERDCKKVYLDHIMKDIDPDIDTAVMTDLDSYKIGPANSKWIKVIRQDGTTVPVLEYVVEALDAKYKLSGGGSLPADFDLDKEFSGLKFWEAQRSDGARLPEKISDVLPGLKISMVEGVNGPTVDISYDENGLMSYAVANVSHEAYSNVGRTPRNHMLDATTMSIMQMRLHSGQRNLAAQKNMLKLLSDWGVAATAVFGQTETIASLIRTSSGLRDLLNAGENPDGQAMKEELLRTVLARLRENLNIPLCGIDSPLCSSATGTGLLRDGAGRILYDDRGRPRIFCQSDSTMLYDLNLGPVVFTDEEKKFYRTAYRFGLSEFNCTDAQFRYGWWMDEKKFDAEFLGDRTPTDENRVLALEMVFDSLVKNRDLLTSEDNIKLRRRLASCFVDHHGLHLNEKFTEKELSAICFTDLFMQNPDGEEGEIVFDRSAVQIGQDRVHLDADERTGGGPRIFLGGSAITIDRTPSGNGKSIQICRASKPVNEIAEEVKTEDGTVVTRYMSGTNAAVAPCPAINEIEGSDHDGDKTRVAFLMGTLNGEVMFDEFPGILDGVESEDQDTVVERFASDPDFRAEYFARLKAAGFVSQKFDKNSGAVVRKITNKARLAASNRFLFSLFDLVRQNPCPEAKDRRVSFVGGPCSEPVQTFPGSLTKKKELLKRNGMTKDSHPAIPEGHRLNEVDRACGVTSKARDVSRARARAVSTSKTLDSAYMSGFFDSGERQLFRGLTPERYLMFKSRYDGLPQATFDDVKEQACSRMGFTEGMISVLTTDMLLNYDERTGTYGPTPVTDAEFDRITEQFVVSCNDYGIRYYMLIMSQAGSAFGYNVGDLADGAKARLAWRNLTNYGQNSTAQGRWANFFGLSLFPNRDGSGVHWAIRDKAVIDRKKMTVGQYIASLVEEISVSDEFKDLRKMMGNPSRSRLFSLLAYTSRHHGVDAVNGYLFGLAREVSGCTETDNFLAISDFVKGTRIDATSVSEDTRSRHLREISRYLVWKHVNGVLDGAAREFGNSFNYMSVDPGADYAVDSYKQIMRATKNARGYESSDGPVLSELFRESYLKMNAATRVAYDIGHGLETSISRAKDSVYVDDETGLEDHRADLIQDLHRIAARNPSKHELNRVLAGLVALDKIDQRDTKGLKASAQMHPAIIAALQTTGDRTPLENLKLLDDIASAIQLSDRIGDDVGLDTVPGSRGRRYAEALAVLNRYRDGAALSPEDQTISDKVTIGFSEDGQIFRMCRGIEAAFELMYRLATTSTEHFDCSGTGNSAFAYFSEQTDASYQNGGYDNTFKLNRIVPLFGGSTDVLMARAQDMVRRVMNGESFAGVRTRTGGTSKTLATSFSLSLENIDNARKEMESTRPKDKITGKRRALGSEDIQLLKQVEAVVSAIGEITPQRMFNELLPLYTAITSRTAGAPRPGSSSLLSLLPGVYQKWSSQMVKNDAVSREMVSIGIGTNSAPVNKTKRANPGRKQPALFSRNAIRNIDMTGYYGKTTDSVRETLYRQGRLDASGSAPESTPSVRYERDLAADWACRTLGLGDHYTVQVWQDFVKDNEARVENIVRRMVSAGIVDYDYDPRRILFEFAMEANLAKAPADRIRPVNAPADVDVDRHSNIPRKDPETGAPVYVYGGKQYAVAGRRLVNPLTATVEKGDPAHPLQTLFRDHGAVVVFDTETNGVDPRLGNVVQIAAIRYEWDDAAGAPKATKVLKTLVALPAGQKITEESAKVHHITDSMLDSAPDMATALSQFETLLEQTGDKRTLLVAHNAQFDAAHMAAEFMRVKGNASVFDNCDWLDTLTVFRDRTTAFDVDAKYEDKNNPGVMTDLRGHTLTAAIAHYADSISADVRNDHNAENDMIALHAVLCAMDEERADLHLYVNRFGVNPRYGEPLFHIPGVAYCDQAVMKEKTSEKDKTLVDPSECLYSRRETGIFSTCVQHDVDTDRASALRSHINDEEEGDAPAVTGDVAPGGYTALRANPEGQARTMVDVFAGDGLLAHMAEYLLNPVEAPSALRGNSFGAQTAKDLRDGRSTIDKDFPEDAEIDPRTKRIAYGLRAMAPWLDVTFTGPNTFVLKGRMRNGLTTGAGTAANVLIRVDTLDLLLDSAEHVTGLAESPEYAASFVAVHGEKFGMETSEDFLRLPLPTRERLVKRYHVGAMTLNQPMWTVGADGLATLCGAISLGNTKADSAVYHEYFHAMISMFNTIGLFSEEDIAAFREEFGEPPQGTGWLFDEEKAAERYREFVIKGADAVTENRRILPLFHRLFDFIKNLFRAMAKGFRYDTQTDVKLFSLVLHGVAAQSEDRLSGAPVQLPGFLGAVPLVMDVKRGPRRKSARPLEQNDKLGKTVRGLTDKELRDYLEHQVHEARAGVVYASEIGHEEYATANGDTAGIAAVSAEKAAVVDRILEDPQCPESVLIPALRDLLGVRRDMPVSPVRADELAGRAADGETGVTGTERVRFAVTLGSAPIGSESTQFWKTGRTIAEVVQSGLAKDGSWSRLENLHAMYGGSETDAAKTVNPVDKLVIRHAIQEAHRLLGPSGVKLTNEQLDGLVFESMLVARQSIDSLARSGEYTTLGNRTRDLGEKIKRDSSAYDVSAWIMSSAGVSIEDTVHETIRQLNDLAERCGEQGKQIISYYRTILTRVLNAAGDVKSITSILERNSDKDPFMDIVDAMQRGLDYNGIEPDGSIRDYTVNRDVLARDDRRAHVLESVLDSRVLSDPSSADYANVQMAIKSVMGTVYNAMAMVKYHRCLGIVPASAADIAFSHQVSGMAVKHQTADEWCRFQAIGNSNLLDNEDLVDYYNQSYFIANNMDQWLSSQIRSTFGGMPHRDIMLRDKHEFAGIMSEIADLENCDGFLYGDTSPAGGRLLAIVLRDRNFKFDAGTIRYSFQGDKVIGFDNYNRKTCSVTLTKDERDLIDWFKKSVTNYIKGSRFMVTGIDNVKFVEGDAIFGVHALDQDTVRHTVETSTSRQELSRFQWTLYRMTCQLPDVVRNDGVDVDGAPRKGLYNRFVEAAVEAVQRANDTLQTFRDMARRGTLTNPDQKDEYEKFDFNDYVLRELEKKRLVVCRYSGGKRTEAVLVHDVDEADELFRKSTAFAKLTSEARWAGCEDYIGGKDADEAMRRKALRESAFSREEMARRYREVYSKLARFVKEHPWLTAGDTKYLHSFGTLFPFFRGSGIFTLDATRTERDRRTKVEQTTGYEATFYQMCTTKDNAFALDEVPAAMEGRVVAAVNLFRDILGITDLTVKELRSALVEGRFANGGDLYEKLAAYGVDGVQAHPTYGTLRDVIYRVELSKLWGDCMTDGESVRLQNKERARAEEIVRLYEQTTGGSETAIIGGLGMTDETMYRLHGVLPANYQIGKMVHKAAESIIGAVMYRNTFMSMMLTPSSDGAPVYYMKPDEKAAELSGIPDECWGQVARWWASFHGIAYDEASSGVANARRIYDLLKERGATDQKTGLRTWRLRAGDSDHRYIALNDKDLGLSAVSGILCMEDEDLGEGSSGLNALAQGEAAGYMKQFAWSAKSLGFAGLRAGLHRVLSWSKSMSVSFSFFFPLATRFESPIGAVGAIPTLVGNSKWASDAMRAHPELFNGLQKIFGGSGWITKDFIGTDDIIRLMDSYDPFLAELKSWIHAVGLTYSDQLFNPLEHTGSVVGEDVKRIKAMLRRVGFGHRMDSFLDSLVTRSGEKAFTYALNAVKIATVAQLAMKLRHEAYRAGKAFDPIRELRKYSTYLNAEIGGIDERAYAWSHPMFRGLMNCLMFSWPWTRGAWEAGGGAVIEDFVLGGHSFTRQERKYLLGRWARMYGEVMIGVPMMMQILCKAAAVAMGRDDEDDKWFTWQNEDKTKWTAYNITPLMKALHDHEDVAGIAGRVVGALAGAKRFGLLGAVAGLAFGDRLVPNYTGGDTANAKTKARKYYMHFGKQGWEFFRWFDEPGKQFASKLSMPVQRLLEGFLGRNLSYLDHELPWDDMGPAERWLSLSSDSALVNLAKAFMPFTVSGMTTFGDAGILPVFGPVQMGVSQTAVQKDLVKAVERWAANDRKGYAWGAWNTRTKGRVRTGAGISARIFGPKVSDILRDARLNGLDPAEQLTKAIGQVTVKYYGQLFKNIPDDPREEFDTGKLNRIVRVLHRLGVSRKRVMQSVKTRMDATVSKWNDLEPEQRALIDSVIGTSWDDPFHDRTIPAISDKPEDY